MRCNVFTHRWCKTAAACSVFLLFLGSTVTAEAQQAPVRIRFIAASPTGDPPSPRGPFQDLLPLLRNLRFKSFESVTDTTVPLRAGATARLRYGYTVEFTTVDATMATVRVVRNRKALLSTRLRLVPGKPVLLGGFPHQGDSRLIIVLTLTRLEGRIPGG